MHDRRHCLIPTATPDDIESARHHLQFAIDGGLEAALPAGTDPLKGTVQFTSAEQDPWWELDLGAERPIETRIIRWLDGEVEYAVYRWDDAGTSAALTAIDRPIRVAVSAFGESFEHVIPARLDCRKCHESQPVRVLGFDELGLAEAPEQGPSAAPALAASLAGWVELGVLSAAPAEPRLIRHEEALTQGVLSYIEGNCTHCHNGGTEASASYDLRYGVALENLIDRDTEGEALSGLRIASGNPEQSALFLALRREDRDGIQPMPPLGVERRDEVAIELFQAWISGLPAAP